MIVFRKRELLIAIVVILAVVTFVPWWLHTVDTVPVRAELTTIMISEKTSSEFSATGYALGKPYSTITRSGSLVANHGAIAICGVNFFTIAVDPAIIPLGSLVYIDSLGLAMASDTGPDIKGMKIDICFRTMAEAMQWGKRSIQVTMIHKGESPR